LRKIASSRRALAAPARCCLPGSRRRYRCGDRRGGHRALDDRLIRSYLTGLTGRGAAGRLRRGTRYRAGRQCRCAPRSPPIRYSRKRIRPTWIGIRTIGAIRTICSCRSSTDGSSTEAHRHSTGYGRTTTIDASASNATAGYATVINARMTNANASSIGEGVS
jgi:hypothetical protein